MAYTIATEVYIAGSIPIKPCYLSDDVFITCRIIGSTVTFYKVTLSSGILTETALTGTLSVWDSVFSIKALDSSKIVILYNSGGSDTFRAIVASLSGTALSYGSYVSIGTNRTAGDIAILSSSKFIVKSDSSTTSYFICGTVSGTTITLGTEVSEGGAGSDGQLVYAFKLDTDKAGFVYQDSSRYPTAIVCTVSGTTITKGTSVTIRSTNMGTQYMTAACLLDTDKFLVLYSGGVNKAVVCTVSTTTITVNTEASITDMDSGYSIDLSNYSPSKAIALVGSFNGGAESIFIFDISISGTTPTQAISETYKLTGATYRKSIQTISSTNFAITRDGSTNGYVGAGYKVASTGQPAFLLNMI